MSTLSDNVRRNTRRLRRSCNLTQDELAAKAGFRSGNSISDIELGHRSSTLSLDTVDLLASALGVSPADLLAEPATCRHCSGTPPQGFTCTTCGQTGL